MSVCISVNILSSSFFFFNDPATTDIYTLSLHDALPISPAELNAMLQLPAATLALQLWVPSVTVRSEEHTSELQSRGHLVCRLLLEKKKKDTNIPLTTTQT